MEPCDFPARAPLAVQIVFLGHRLTNLFERRLAGHGHSHTQAAVLMALRRNPGLIAQHLVGPISVEAPSITRALQALERRRLVERRPHPTDGRASIFYLTGTGEVEAQRIASLMQEISGEIEAGLAPEQRQILREALPAVLARIEQARGVAV